MIKVGDIVFRKYSGGILGNRIDHSKVGLVLELYQPPGTIAQYKVNFTSDGNLPGWFEGRHLTKIKGEKENDA
jgi:hypothetical protein